MIKKITSFTHHVTAEGQRLSFTYSVIDGDGNLVTSNKRDETIAVDKKVLDAIDIINEALQPKIPD